MIGLQEKEGDPGEGVGGLLRHVSAVRQDAQLIEAEVAGARGVVGGGEGRHGDLPDGEAAAGLNGPELGFQPRDAVAELPAAGGGGEDGHVPALDDGGKAGDMVAVGMGDADGGEVLRAQSQLPQGPGDPPGGDAGVQQDVGPVPAHQGGVAGGAAGKGMDGCQSRFPLYVG